MKLYTKLLVGFGSLWCVLLLATLMLLAFLDHQSIALQDAFRNNFESVDYCIDMAQAFDLMDQQLSIALRTNTSIDEASLQPAWNRYQAAAEKQRQNVTLPGEDKLTDTLFNQAEQYHQAMDQFLSAHDDRSRIYRDLVWPRYKSARDTSLSIHQLNFDHLRSVKVQLQQNLRRARMLQIGFVLVGGAMAIASVVVLAKTILGPLRSLTQSVRQVEAGDLDLRVPITSQDELGELGLAFNAMAATLREYRQLDQSRLQRTMQTTQLAIDSLPDAVAVLNPQGRVEISNRQARLHFGLLPDADHAHEIPGWLSELVRGPLSTGRSVEPQGYESAVQLFDRGEERFLLPRAEAMFRDGGQIIGVVVILVDVTSLRRAHEFKSGLLAAVSHELKTPLAAARFSSHLLAEETIAPLDDRLRQVVQAACEGTDRLHRIIENILQFQRFEEGRQQVRIAAVSPECIVGQAVAAFRDEFEQHGLELAVQLESDLPSVSADADLVGHVIGNLLSNAMKFVPRGGQVTISASSATGEVAFTVSDNGPGIPFEHLPHLFTRFYRAAAPPGIPGAGLGLFIARQLIEAQHGSIMVRSTPGQGAQFVFTLKVVEND